jgi:GNAT superfamily N-acetyltransferase
MEVADLAFRRAGIEDAAALARTTQLGFESYRSWAPDGWRPPDHRLEIRGIRERLKRPDVWCLVAVEPGGEPAGHVGFIAAAGREPPYAGIPGRAHLWMLFVRPHWWGTGLATRLHRLGLDEAQRQGYRTIRLYTPEGQMRARAFYAREGWTLCGRPFDEPLLGLQLVEYRRELCSSR